MPSSVFLPRGPRRLILSFMTWHQQTHASTNVLLVALLLLVLGSCASSGRTVEEGERWDLTARLGKDGDKWTRSTCRFVFDGALDRAVFNLSDEVTDPALVPDVYR